MLSDWADSRRMFEVEGRYQQVGDVAVEVAESRGLGRTDLTPAQLRQVHKGCPELVLQQRTVVALEEPLPLLELVLAVKSGWRELLVVVPLAVLPFVMPV